MSTTHPCGNSLVTAAFLIMLSAAPSTVRADETDIHLRTHMVPTPSQTCGLHSLYLCAKARGYSFTGMRELYQRAAPLDARGTNASDLLKWGREYGLEIEAVLTDMGALRRWGLPAIPHVNDNHYIVLAGWDQGRLVVFDNNFGLVDCTPQWFQEHYRWDGVALVVGHLPPMWVDAGWRFWPILPLVAAGVLLFFVAQQYRRRRVQAA